jgi:hypothetical protein
MVLLRCPFVHEGTEVVLNQKKTEKSPVNIYGVGEK